MSRTIFKYGLIAVVLMYVTLPFYFEKRFYFNELLALLGILIFCGKGLRIKRSPISVLMMYLLILAGLHAIASLFRADDLYYYLRNMVIFYSMFSFFVGYYLFKDFVAFIRLLGFYLKFYLLYFLFFPGSGMMLDRFGASTLFPIFGSRIRTVFQLPLMIALTLIYSYNYESTSMLVLVLFLGFIYILPSYGYFRIAVAICFILFATVFIYLTPYLAIDPDHYSHDSDLGIREVIQSHPLLQKDPNNTWRLVIWKQIIVDLFPANLLGIGFGTPALNFFPIEDYQKLDSLPYVLGGHNSFVYLFGRLGIGFIIIVVLLYSYVFREYFKLRSISKNNSILLVFISFFAITGIALFNPVLETPIYASAYWMILGSLAFVIDNRKKEEYAQ